MGKVLVLGGYGNFGKRIATALTKKGIAVLIAGRDGAKARALAAALPQGLAEGVALDVAGDLAAPLAAWRPVVVVNTCGPFQGAGYEVARAAIAAGIHYVDLADGRDFVTGITALDAAAKAAEVAVISGASTVPGLSSAVIEAYAHEFSDMTSLRFGISPGQRAERGLATTRGILSYAGRRSKPFAGAPQGFYGWQDVYRQRFPILGKRWMANCDIPDLDLLPARYGFREIRFSAGLELGLLHLGLAGLAFLVRLGLPLPLTRLAPVLLKVADAFDPLGSADGGMFLEIRGHNRAGALHLRRWFIVARGGDGPEIPTIPAILLTERLVRGTFERRGAMPCVGLVTLDGYIAELRRFNVTILSD